MFDYDECVKEASAALARLNKIDTPAKFFAMVENTDYFWVDGIKCHINNDILTGTCGLPPRYMPAACFIPDLKVIVINEFAAYKLPRVYLEAIIQHEIGHYQYAHYTKERVEEHELQADRYSFDKGCDIVGALQFMVDIVENELCHPVFDGMVDELKLRIGALKALDK